MRHIISILLLACISLSSYAQTPYDSFAPETSRPVLELSEIKESKEGSKNTALTDTVVILDVDVRKWLSIDPLSDKYPGISPYAYCAWNPINAIDPDGREEWDLDVNTGKFQNIGNKGGSSIDYYSIGVHEGELFSSFANFEVERDGGTINSFRIQETDKSTISAFHIPETNVEGFFLERPGPDTEKAGQSLRIPAGQYGLHENPGSNYPGVPRLYLPNEGIGGKFDTRGILIHRGNYPDDSKGCLLPGSSRTIDFVGNSKIMLPQITNYVTSKNWLVKLNIFNAFK